MLFSDKSWIPYRKYPSVPFDRACPQVQIPLPGSHKSGGGICYGYNVVKLHDTADELVCVLLWKFTSDYTLKVTIPIGAIVTQLQWTDM